MEIEALEELEKKLHMLIDHLQVVKEENQRLRQFQNQSSTHVDEAVKKIRASLQKISQWIDKELKEEATLNNECRE
ncbi:MAG: hypothetical protein PHE86_04025 [Candidatus Marinimicrobia bacterium]|nr:hypothetical protein [Candidatus Neomarinimicrobiota bacterium]MDD5582590.1 hypothetical protein [Candidatus Neomarinimicrobiota bacterium]